ncbi:MAG: phosphoglucosamine mutase [Deltaproteobacteria bacterium]|jgi:phosphoglucosamine mutase|nr:phosphoglucosamine mutase [Deltaproteobacteria bacterium]MDA8306572.1 phosphoglucosamine mutase [Deltaproteobacteria bacterium]
MGKLFGTDGIRGVANIFPMTTDLAMKVGSSTAYIFKSKHRRPKIIIGKDTRISGYMIENAITSGICSMGVDVLLVGPLPTPGIAYITSSMRADAGIVISASHNPYEYNGIKIFGNDGFKLPDETENYIEELVLSGDIDKVPKPPASGIGKARRIDDAQGRYIVYLKNTFPRDLTLEGLKIVIDCANGAAYRVAPSVFEELGAEVVLTGDRPNGKNINRDCGALFPGNMAAVVRDSGANAGFALDGDADRVILADEKGEILDGDQIMAICAKHFIERGRLKDNTVVATIMSNLGFEVALRALGGSLIRTPVGDRYVVEQMRKNKYNLGGEQSGHMIFLDHGTTGDGILSALQVFAVMLREGRPLSELKKIMEHYPQKLVNVSVCTKKPIEQVPEITRLQRAMEERLGTEGRLVIRPSGTEPVIRVMVEGADCKVIEEVASSMVSCIRQHMNGEQ